MRLPLAIVLCAAALCLRAETNDLKLAQAALRDGLWGLARTHAARVNSDAGRLVTLETYAAEGSWENVKKTLASYGDAAKGEPYDYYRAVVSGDYKRAADLLAKSGSAAGTVASKMLEAALRVKANERAEAERLWREVVATTNADDTAYATACVNLGDVKLLRVAYARMTSPVLRRLVGIRLGTALVSNVPSTEEGARLIRAIVQETPDVAGAADAYLALGAAEARTNRWQQAADIYRDMLEIWPAMSKRADVQLARGDVFAKLTRLDEALTAYVRAEELAADDGTRVLAVQRQGDLLALKGNVTESLEKYREAVKRFPKTDVAAQLKKIVAVREREQAGREHYRAYRFEEARKDFAAVAQDDPARAARMAFYDVLCQYGLMQDDAACRAAEKLSATCTNAEVRADATLWLGKFHYNRGEWREAETNFNAYVAAQSDRIDAPEALLWATRAAFANGDYDGTIQTATRLAERYPESTVVPAALIVQSEALIEQVRFDAAILVLERVLYSKRTSAADAQKAQMLKADALFAMGADNPSRYEAALETYRTVENTGDLTPSVRMTLAFKRGRALEKLKRRAEAEEQYYTQVVLAYRSGRAEGVRYDDEARAAFSRAAFRLAEAYEAGGRDYQAKSILELVATSDVPAAAEAARRLANLTKKGIFP